MGYASKVRDKGTRNAPETKGWSEVPIQPSDPVVERVWSEQQSNIYAFAVDNHGHLIVRARAGTGKTTTIVEAVKRYCRAHPGKRVVVCAFNKRIAEELVTRFVGFEGVEVKTLHALGFMLIKRYWGGVRVCQRFERQEDLTNRVVDRDCPDTIRKLVSKLHTKGREIHPLATAGRDLLEIAITFECEPDDFWCHQGYSVEYICDHAVKAMELAAAEKPTRTGIDFADMIYLPVRNNWMGKEYDRVVVDEAQDMTLSQLLIAQGVCRGALWVVGDDRQAIYGFRGADTGSLDRLKAALGATELGLTTTYRCGKNIVALARELVGDFEAGPNNGDGTITNIARDTLLTDVSLGNFVLSRTNAPLVATAMALLRAGKRTRVAGRDIGQGLKGLVRQFSKGATGIPAMLERLQAWEAKQVKRAMVLKWTQRVDQIQDQAETLRHLAVDAKSIADIDARIENLFTDDGLGQAGVITCSSVHRAKGLEADKVYVLAWTLRDRDQEELNIRYVAITRARHELVFVHQ